jgi:hypothetical protein
MEVMFTVFTAFKLIENSFWERSETLRTTGNMKDAIQYICPPSMHNIHINENHQHVSTGYSHDQKVFF